MLNVDVGVDVDVGDGVDFDGSVGMDGGVEFRMQTPYSTPYAWRSCHSGLANRRGNCVDSSRAQQWGPLLLFWSCGPSAWLELLLIKRSAPIMRTYPPSTIYRYVSMPYTQRIQTQNTHIYNTTTPSQILDQARTHPKPSPQTPPTPLQPKHRHTSHTPPVQTHLPSRSGINTYTFNILHSQST